MAQNELGEIKAAEARLELAKKAKAWSSKNVEAAIIAAADGRRALDDAKRALDNANKNLDEAKREDTEAVEDLGKAEAALKDVNSKWEVNEVDIEDEDDSDGKKRSALVAMVDDTGNNKKRKKNCSSSIFDAKSIKVDNCSDQYVVMNGVYVRSGKASSGLPVFEHQHYRSMFSVRFHNTQWHMFGRFLSVFRCTSRGDNSDPLRDEWKATNKNWRGTPPKFSVNELA